MTPALLFGPVLVALAFGSTVAAAPIHRHIQKGSVTIDAVAHSGFDGNAAGRLNVRMRGVSQNIGLRPRGMTPEMLVSSVQLVDVNFDGHLDVVVLRDWGAKWGMSDVYLFDARTHRFSDVSSLAHEIALLPNVGFDAQKRHVTSYDIGPSRPSRQVYEVSGTSLRLAESCMFLNDGDERIGVLVRSRLVGGAMHSTYTKLRLGSSDIAPCGP